MRSWMYKNKFQLNDANTEVVLIFSVHNQSSKFNVFHIQVGSVPDLGLWRPLGNNVIEKSSTS